MADIEGLIPLHIEGDGPLHPAFRHTLAVDRERADTTAPNRRARCIGLELEGDGVAARGQRRRPFPLHPLDIEEVPGPDRPAFPQVEAVAAEAAPLLTLPPNYPRS
jgi:hypothetical protein